MSDPDTPPLPLFTTRSWAVAGSPMPQAQPATDVASGLELFTASFETGTDGYAAWKTDIAAHKTEEAEHRRRAELPMQTDAAGFKRWRQEAEEARRAFEKRWGIPMGKPVRVLLRGESREREGVLRQVEEQQGKSTRQLRLSLGGHIFHAAQIESLVRV